MNQQMITAWNNVVNEKDTVYHLGDVAMHPLYEKGFKDILEQLVQLTGKIVFIKGNHDSRTFFRYLAAHDPKLANGENKFEFHDVGAIVKFNHHQYYLTHYPMLLGKTLNIPTFMVTFITIVCRLLKILMLGSMHRNAAF